MRGSPETLLRGPLWNPEPRDLPSQIFLYGKPSTYTPFACENFTNSLKSSRDQVAIQHEEG
jgi:hypothetical protein